MRVVSQRNPLDQASPLGKPAPRFFGGHAQHRTAAREFGGLLMQDDNSLDIADILLGWIGKHVTGCSDAANTLPTSQPRS